MIELLTDREREALQSFVIFVRNHEGEHSADPLFVQAFTEYMTEAQSQDQNRERWHRVVDDAQLHEAERRDR